MLDLAMVARRLRQSGGAMIISGAQPQIFRLIELTGLQRLAGVRVTAPEPPAPAAPAPA
jgi:anti-anti-sigma regulatory factor